jgi:hypothetical protein
LTDWAAATSQLRVQTYKRKSLAGMGEALWLGTLTTLRSDKAAIQDRFVLAPEVRITPGLELLDFVNDQCPDRLKQLFFEEPCVETHSGEDRLEIIKHFFHSIELTPITMNVRLTLER